MAETLKIDGYSFFVLSNSSEIPYNVNSTFLYVKYTPSKKYPLNRTVIFSPEVSEIQQINHLSKVFIYSLDIYLNLAVVTVRHFQGSLSEGQLLKTHIDRIGQYLLNTIKEIGRGIGNVKVANLIGFKMFYYIPMNITTFEQINASKLNAGPVDENILGEKFDQKNMIEYKLDFDLDHDFTLKKDVNKVVTFDMGTTPAQTPFSSPLVQPPSSTIFSNPSTFSIPPTQSTSNIFNTQPFGTPASTNLPFGGAAAPFGVAPPSNLFGSSTQTSNIFGNSSTSALSQPFGTNPSNSFNFGFKSTTQPTFGFGTFK